MYKGIKTDLPDWWGDVIFEKIVKEKGVKQWTNKNTLRK